MAKQIDPSAMETLIDPGARLTRLAGGFQFTEGPVWSPPERCLYFSDIPADVRWRWGEARGTEVVMRPAFKANGLVLDAEGNLIACEHISSSVVRYRPSGEREVLAYHHRGKYLNSPNDIITSSADGSIYFTDPDYGRLDDFVGIRRTSDIGFKGVYRVPKDGGETELLVDEGEFDQPNGLCFSPDQSLLYINDSPRGEIKVWDVAADGSLANKRMFFEGVGVDVEDLQGDPAARRAEHESAGEVDGMKCDELGNVWVTGPGGIWVISPDGRHLGVIETPEVVANLTWGGVGWRSLFLTTSTSLHVVETRVGPAPLPFHGAPRPPKPSTPTLPPMGGGSVR